MLFTPDDHADNSPATWRVTKAAERLWYLVAKDGGVLKSFKTKRQAVQEKQAGFLVDLYDKEGRWYRGEHIPGWRPFGEAEGGEA